MSGDLSSRVRQAILADLEKIEAYHHRRMMELRAADIWPEADAQQRLAETVRACIVTAQGAATRAIEEPQV